jgi:hypothetical protein
MSNAEEELYRSSINILRTIRIDLDSCFASPEATEALERAIEACERDFREKSNTDYKRK